MQLKKSEAVYECGNLMVVAYPTQDVLGACYLRFKQERMLEYFFHEWEAVPELSAFLNWCMEPGSLVFGAFRRLGQDVVHTVGLVKVSAPKTFGGGHSKAEVCMIFFREWQVREITIPSCQMMIEYVFDRTQIDVLYGTIPERNRASLRFMKAIGFEHLKEPIKYYTSWRGEQCGAFVSWMSESQWRAISPFAK